MANRPNFADLLADVDCPCALLRHNDDLAPPELITVTEGVYSAFGYGIANSIIFEGPQGLLVVDTMDTTFGAEKVLKAIREATPKPIQAVVYTHHHTDHVGGTEVFVEDKNSMPEIWAHELFYREIQTLSRISRLVKSRGLKQFGPHLGEAKINCGIGITLDALDSGRHSGLVAPTNFMKGARQNVTLAGIGLELVHIPGETNDQIGVWWPERKVFVCADDVYKAFPNLYAIRGTVPRNVLDWVESLNKMLELDIEHLVPCHTRPVSGKKEITDILTAYRDAILYVHDETVRLMNQGMHPDDIADTVKLPARLAQHPYLAEYYGTVKWSVKAVVSSYVGWFSGDPVELSPLTPRQRADKYIAAIGGIDKVNEVAEKALSAQEYQWALELASHVQRVDQSNAKARDVRTKALKKLAGQQISANGRHWYLSAVLRDHGILSEETRVEITSVLSDSKL